MFSRQIAGIGFWVAVLVATSACRTGGLAASDAANLKAGEQSPASGYFITVSADKGKNNSAQFYDKLYDAVEGYARKQAKAAGELDTYLEELSASGAATISRGEDEIECDRKVCRLKLRGRHLGPEAHDEAAPPFSERLMTALESAGAQVATKGAGDHYVKTATIGKVDGLHLACAETKKPGSKMFTCDFDLDQAKGADADAAFASDKGKLVGCVLSPGVVKTAEEARATLENGKLLPLTSGPSDGSKPVGYLRYTQQGKTVELVDLYLCGDLSQDNFFFVGPAKQPAVWVAALKESSAGATGNGRAVLPPAHHDEADLSLEATRVAATARDVTLEVHFKIVPPTIDPATGGNTVFAATSNVFGEDKFFVKFNKDWLK